MAEDSRAAADVLDAREAAHYLRLNEQTVRRLARQRDIPAFKVGGSWRFRRVALDRWVAGQEEYGGPRRIVVVEDQEPMRTLIQRTLERAGYKLEIISHLPQLEELLERGRPDVLMLNAAVPQAPPLETLQAVRNGWGAVPIVVLTGGDDAELLPALVRFSPLILLARPATPQQILKAVGDPSQ